MLAVGRAAPAGLSPGPASVHAAESGPGADSAAPSSALTRFFRSPEGAAAAGVLGLILLGLALFRRGPRRPSSAQCQTWLKQADACVDKDPKGAGALYRRVIAAVEPIAGKAGLDALWTEALGRAYLGDCAVLLAEGDDSAARARYQKASKLIPIAGSRVTPKMARLFLRQSETGEEALAVYLAVLRSPAADVPRELAASIEALLRNPCQIILPSTPGPLQWKVQVNTALATVPCIAPALVVLTGMEAGSQFELAGPVTIGRGAGNTVVLRHASVAEKHASIAPSPEGPSISDLGSGSVTEVSGDRVAGPRKLVDGDVIKCGELALGVYLKPRPLGKSLGWAHENLGAYHLLRGVHPKAKQALTFAVKLRPEHADPHWLMGCAFRATSEYDQALREFLQALKISKTHTGALHGWGETVVQLLESGRGPEDPEERAKLLEEAIAHLQHASTADKSRHECLYDLARALVLAGRKSDAVGAVRSALTIHQRNKDYYLLLARLSHEMKSRSMAMMAAQYALALDPTNLEAHFLYGYSCFQATNYAKAASHLNWVKDKEAQTGEARFSTPDSFQYALGRSLYETGRYAPASMALARAAKSSREALFYTGRCHSQVGGFETAAGIFRGMLARGDDPAARYYLACAQGNLGKFPDALKTLDGGGRAADWTQRRLCMAAKLLMRMGRLDDAEKRLKQAPADGRMRFEQGRLACVRGDFARAGEHFSAVLRKDPGDARSSLAGPVSFRARQARRGGRAARGRAEDRRLVRRERPFPCRRALPPRQDPPREGAAAGSPVALRGRAQVRVRACGDRFRSRGRLRRERPVGAGHVPSLMARGGREGRSRGGDQHGGRLLPDGPGAHSRGPA